LFVGLGIRLIWLAQRLRLRAAKLGGNFGKPWGISVIRQHQRIDLSEQGRPRFAGGLSVFPYPDRNR
jgi:hypothetical protein